MRAGGAQLAAIGVLACSSASVAQPVDLTAQLGVEVNQQRVSALIEVCNAGGTDGHGDSQVALILHGESTPGCGSPADKLWKTWALEPEACDTYHQVQRNVAAGTYTAWAVADAQCVLTETHEDNNLSRQVYYVGPNLRLRNPEVAVTAGEVTFRVQACNENSSKKTDVSEVALWHSTQSEPACGDATHSHTWQLRKLAVGACRELSHTIASVPNGTHRAYFVADPQCALAESREDDNVEAAAFSVGSSALPDLQVTALSAEVDGEGVALSFEVCNVGDTAAANVDVAVFRDRDAEPRCSDSADHEVRLPSLAAGACQAHAHSHIGASSGSKQAWVLVDSDCSVAEVDERNNTRSYGYSIADPLPDLRIETLDVQVVDSQVTYVLEVCNGGASTELPFTLGLTYGASTAPGCSGALDWTTTLPGLAGGACLRQTHERIGAPAGNYRAHAAADADCVLAEVDDNNNHLTASYEIVVRRPDFVVTKLSAQPSGKVVRYAATVCNDGTEASGTTVGLFFNSQEEPDCADEADLRREVTDLQPGGCANVLWVRREVPFGDYVAYALADAACDRVEADEGNNTASGGYRVGEIETHVEAGNGASADAGGADGGVEQAAPAGSGDSGAAADSGASRPSPGGCDMASGGPGPASLWLIALLVPVAVRRRRDQRS